MARNANGNGNGQPHFEQMYDQTAERLVLGALLVDDPQAGCAFELLGVEDFSEQCNQLIFRRMKALHKRHEPIDRITVAHDLIARGELDKVGGISYLVSLDDGMPQNSHVDRYVRMVRDASLRRQAVLSCQVLTQGLMQSPADANELFDSHRERLARIAESAEAAGPIDLVARIPTLAQYQICTRYLIEDLIVEGALTLLTGSYGDGKSTLALALAHAVASGKPILGRATIQKPVIIIDRENGIDVVKERMLRLGVRDDQIPLRVWGLWGDSAHRQPPDPDASEVLEYARASKPLFIWDSLVAFARCDENSAAEMRRHLSLYRRLAAMGATCVILHHSSEKSEGGSYYRGSSDIPAAVDTAFHVSRDDGTCAGNPLGRLLIRPYKTRISPGKLMRVEYKDGEFTSVDSPPPSPRDVLVELVAHYPGRQQKELLTLAERQGITKYKFRDCLDSLVLQQIIVTLRSKKNTLRYYLPDTLPKLVN